MVRRPIATEVIDEEEIDNCGCDVEFHDSESVPDSDLPPAVGGVAELHLKDDDEDADGCALDFTESEPTADEELPGSMGGVA